MFYIDINVDFSTKDINFNFLNPIKGLTLDEDKIFDLHLAFLGIIATFLGLYFAAVSIIAQTIYSKVNGEIANLLKSIRLSNIYIKVLIFMLSFLFVSICFALYKNYTINIAHLYLIILFSYVSIVCFWELGSYIFLFFNPANLIHEYILPQIENNIYKISKSNRIYKNDNSFQHYIYQETIKLFDTYDIISEFAIKQDLFQSNVINKMFNDLLNISYKYILLKSIIPVDSYWYPQKNKFKKYINSNISEIELSLNTATMLQPEIVKDYIWFEKRCLNIINKLLKNTYSKNKLEDYYLVLLSLSSALKKLSTASKDNEVLYILKNVYNPLKSNEWLEKKDIYNVYIADNYILLYVDIILGIENNQLKLLSEITAKDILKSKINISLPEQSLKVIQEIKNKLFFEKSVKGKITTPDWHIQELVVNSFNSYLENYYKSIIALFSYDSKIYYKPEFLSNGVEVSLAIFTRGFEFLKKLENSTKRLELEKGNFYDLLKIKEIIAKEKEQMLSSIAEALPKAINLNEDIPDYKGFIFTILYQEISDLIIDENFNNKQLLDKLLEALFMLIKYQQECLSLSIDYSEDITVKMRQSMWFLGKVLSQQIDFLNLLGYIILFDDIYNKDLKSLISSLLDRLFNEKKVFCLLGIVSELKNNYYHGADWSVFQFRLENKIRNKLEELDIIKIEPSFLFKKPSSPVHPKHTTKLIEVLCTRDSNFREIKHGYTIFAIKILLDLCNEEQKNLLFKNNEINRLYKELAEDE